MSATEIICANDILEVTTLPCCKIKLSVPYNSTPGHQNGRESPTAQTAEWRTLSTTNLFLISFAASAGQRGALLGLNQKEHKPLAALWPSLTAPLKQHSPMAAASVPEAASSTCVEGREAWSVTALATPRAGVQHLCIQRSDANEGMHSRSRRTYCCCCRCGRWWCTKGDGDDLGRKVVIVVEMIWCLARLLRSARGAGWYACQCRGYHKWNWWCRSLCNARALKKLLAWPWLFVITFTVGLFKRCREKPAGFHFCTNRELLLGYSVSNNKLCRFNFTKKFPYYPRQFTRISRRW